MFQAIVFGTEDFKDLNVPLPAVVQVSMKLMAFALLYVNSFWQHNWNCCSGEVTSAFICHDFLLEPRFLVDGASLTCPSIWLLYNLKCLSVCAWLIAWELNGMELIEFKAGVLWYYRNMSTIHPLCLSFMYWAKIFSMQLRSLLQTQVFWWNHMKGMDLDLYSLTGSVYSPISYSLFFSSVFLKNGCDTSLKLIMCWCLSTA